MTKSTIAIVVVLMFSLSLVCLNFMWAEVNPYQAESFITTICNIPVNIIKWALAGA